MLQLSQGEDGGESGEDEDEEDGFFVPHGYLSDSEGDHSGDEGMQGQDDQVRGETADVEWWYNIKI